MESFPIEALDKITPPVINTFGLELWDGTANVGWYVNGSHAGTEQDPYQIGNGRDLAGLMEIISLGTGNAIAYDNGTASPTYGKVGNNFLSVGSYQTTDFSGKFVKLTNHIYLNTYNPLGDGDADEMTFADFSNSKNSGNPINWNNSGEKAFSGSFDGQNKTVIGLVQNNYSGYGGVFGQIANGDIKNTALHSGYIKATASSGGIVGYANSSSTTNITNCTNYGNITTSSSSGGIVGGISDNSSDPMINITNCTNYGNITSSSRSGGIVGSISNNSSNSMMTVTNCTNYGNITVSSYYSGGIVGYISSNSTINITNCTNYGNVTSSNYYSGGIVGYISNNSSNSTINITNCTNYGNVTSY
ncbi:hypothetical protein FACS1894211_16680 [Clostridia bacterium]|nr:hypothetical protein FACS1894211_16680 [Clostridia bacterium]